MSLNALKQPLSPEEEREVSDIMPEMGRPGLFCRVKPDEWTTQYGIPWKRGNVLFSPIDLDRIQHMKLYPDDLFIVTPPKCGTTWTQEIVWLLLNNVDKEGARVHQYYRSPFMELGSFLNQVMPDIGPYPEDVPKTHDNVVHFMNHSMKYVELMPRPRFIKTHLPLSLLPPKLLDTCKVIFVARNVKDLAVSLYYHCQMPTEKRINFHRFIKLFKEGSIMFTELIPMILEAWGQRNHPNMCFLTFEQLKSDLDGSINILQRFLGTHLSAEKLSELKEEAAFERFRKNLAIDKRYEVPLSEASKREGMSFIRKGEVGDWKNHFDEDTDKEWDEWIKKELDGSDYQMIFHV